MDLYSEALNDVLGVWVADPPMKHGKTDRQNLRDYLRAAGTGLDRMIEVAARLELLSQKRYRNERSARRALPGVAKGLYSVREIGAINALFTGNSILRSEAKLAGAGIDHGWFDWTASYFGSDFDDRPAMARAASRAIKNGVFVGDTPGDGEAALVAGFAFVAVTTGVYGAEALEPYAPLVVLQDMNAQLDLFVRTIQSLYL